MSIILGTQRPTGTYRTIRLSPGGSRGAAKDLTTARSAELMAQLHRGYFASVSPDARSDRKPVLVFVLGQSGEAVAPTSRQAFVVELSRGLIGGAENGVTVRSLSTLKRVEIEVAIEQMRGDSGRVMNVSNNPGQIALIGAIMDHFDRGAGRPAFGSRAVTAAAPQHSA